MMSVRKRRLLRTAEPFVPVQPWPAGHPKAVEKSRPYVPSSQPSLQSEQRSGDAVPGREYLAPCGQDVHPVAPDDWLYRPAGHAKQVPLELYVPREHRTCVGR